MLSLFLQRTTSGLLALTVAGVSLLGPTAGSVLAAPWSGRDQFADEGFRTTWTRTDDGTVRGGRTLYWGPAPWFDYAEFYRQGINGLRTVQYFDKARMEINNPNDRSYQNGVTNGLLVVEMVGGQVQLGNDSFDSDGRGAANVPVAGNPLDANPNAPTYSSFAGVATVNNNGYRDSNRIGQRINATLDKGGNIGVRDALATPETEIVQYNSNTGHNIPRVFWEFMNATGPVLENNRVTTGPIVDWVFAMGLPITDAYWTRARIGNAEQDVLVQLFERRVLTYTPANSAEFKVEMGNVGQHYFQWRYPHLGTPWAAPDPNLPLIYASDKDTGGTHWELYTHLQGTPVRLTQETAESVAYSYRRSFDPTKIRVLIDSRRSDNTHRQLFELSIRSLSGTTGATRLTYTDGKPTPPNVPYQGYLPNGTANDYNAAVSPDGTKVIFVSDREGLPELYIMSLIGMGGPTKLLSDGCAAQVPAWSPDGRRLYWESKCGDAQFKLVKGEIAYGDDRSYGAYANLINVAALMPNQSGDNRFPRVSPDGTQIAFSSTRDGNSEVYVVNVDGSNLRRLTNDAQTDEAPTWNAAGTELAFASNRDGDYEIYTMQADGSNLQRFTNNTTNERWALWAQ